MAIIKAVDVHKVYDTGKIKVEALRGVNLEIKKGEMLTIMGPSGCGKTTLINCLSGLDDLTSGQVWIEGVLLNQMSDDQKTEYRARYMGFIFQFYNLLPVLTAIENVELPLLISGVEPRKAREKALHALENVGLRGWEDHKPAELSGGQRQRVTVARALVNEPKIVWADEPTGDLDEENSRQIVDLLVDLNREYKQTFVIVTHDPNVGERTHRIIRMSSGLIEKEYTPVGF